MGELKWEEVFEEESDATILEAFSAIHDDGGSFCYRIREREFVGKEGKRFEIGGDEELMAIDGIRRLRFYTAGMARDFCQFLENQAICQLKADYLPEEARELAERLNGTEYPLQIPSILEHDIRDAGLVVVFGESDDIIQFRGAIHGEGLMSDVEDTFFLDPAGLLPRYEEVFDEEEAGMFFLRKAKAQAIQAIWNSGSSEDPACWRYLTDIPHASFDILENGEIYCRALVFSIHAL